MRYLKGPILSMNFNETKSGMKKRFENILQNKNKKRGVIALCFALAFVILFGGIVAVNYVTTFSEDEKVEFLSNEDRKKYYIDFAMDYRVDFIPDFDENMYNTNEPISSVDFLMLTYYMNRNDNLPEDLSMSTELVEKVMKDNFGIKAVKHESQFKGWTYVEEESKYTPSPEGTAGEELFDVVGFNTYKDGNQKIYDVMLRSYRFPYVFDDSLLDTNSYNDYEMYANDSEEYYSENVKFLLEQKGEELKNGENSVYGAIYDLIVENNTKGFTVGHTIHIKYYVDSETGKPRFIYKQEGLSDRIFPENYDEIVFEKFPDGRYSTRFVLVRNGNYWGIITGEGKEVLNPDTFKLDKIILATYEEVWPVIEVKKDGKSGMIDYYGNLIIEPRWESVWMDVYNEPNTVFVNDGEKWGEIKLIFDSYANCFEYSGLKASEVNYDIKLSKS